MVIAKAKSLSQKVLPGRSHAILTEEDVRPAREYIADYWQKLMRYHPKDEDSLLGLPHPYLVCSYESAGFDHNELYYWDSYFMAQALLDTKHKKLVTGILDDLFFMFKRFKIIPNASRTYLMGRSQPPLLTSFIFDVYETYDLDKKWLKSSIDLAKEEYETVWMGVKKPNERLVYKGLSRFYDINYLDDLAEAESGWDMTPRFGRHALNFVPVDLNSLLYKYEMDFSRAAELLGKKREAMEWETAARIRKHAMNELMWSSNRRLFYDYNYVKDSRGNVASLASYYTMWAGLASEEQAAKMVNSLRKFENRGGLATTDVLPIGKFVPGALPAQWAYPNGWAPLHFIVIKGLQRYGYHDDAKRIAMKWLHTNLSWFNKHRVFLEKYNVVQPDKPPVQGVYPSQIGFGWTNAVFERFCQEFIDEDTTR